MTLPTAQLAEGPVGPRPVSASGAAPRSRLLRVGGEWTIVLVGVAVLVAWPIGRMLYEVIAAPSIIADLWNESQMTAAIEGTVITSVGGTVLALIIGGGSAVAFWRLRVPAQAVLAGGLLLPILIPPFVSALSVTQAYTAAGLAQHLIGLQMNWLFGAAGTTILLGVQQVPIAFLIIAAATRTRGSGDAERAARASGAPPWTTLWTITFPLLRPAIIAATALCFISCASDFGVPAVLAIPARYPTITTEIYQAMSFSTNGLADPIALSALLIVAALIVFAVTSRFAAAGVAANRHTTPLVIQRRPWHTAVAVLIGLYIFVVSLFPLLGLISIAITKVYGESPVPAHWSFEHLATALQGDAISGFLRSLLLAVLTATILVVAGVLAGRLGLRRGGRALGALIAVPYAVPGSAVAIAILLTFSKFLYGTIAIILVAYLSRFWALAQQPIGAALSQLSPEPALAARASGASAWRAWWVSVWPAIRPSMLAAWLLVFLYSLHELTVSSLLYVPGTETIGVVVLNAEEGGDLATTSAIALWLTIVILLCAVPLIVSRRLRGILGFSSGGSW
ncbi:MAG: hypothetical protein BGO26_13105 [Actinobacteria bacterium 69-20]|nr:iron ABC transporter permease [Actinomycetota bacterium]OJV23612.1 MAG: hypothetical protein BGO26_13105 [Actinobacteria bacterium 69-20]